MIRRASTAALRYSSALLFLLADADRATRLAAKSKGQLEVCMNCGFVLWGTLIL